MISFSKLGNHGRLGNQLFQYAFLRSKARQLNVQYACPNWIGDEIFDLQEQNRVVTKHAQRSRVFKEPTSHTGYYPRTKWIKDGTELFGYFQSSKYFGDAPEKWYSFKSPAKGNWDFRSAVAMHLRFGDYLQLKQLFNPLSRDYYRKALEIIGLSKVFVFSDDIRKAKALLGEIPGHSFQFITGNEPHQDLQLMHLCQANIIANSTFSWWGAWLNRSPEKRVVYPKIWFAPGSKREHVDFGEPEWIGL